MDVFLTGLRAYFLTISAFLLTFWLPIVASAQPLQDIGQSIQKQQLDIKKEQETLQREKLQRELDNDFKQLAPRIKEPAIKSADGQCFVIETILFAGLSGLPKRALSDVTEIAQAFVGRCLHLAEMSDIVSQINQYFLDHGLVTTRAFLPEQSLKKGELLIRVIVGKVQAIESNTLTTRNLTWAFPIESDQLLSLRDIEQGLDQINRLGSNQSTIKLIPGDLPGQSVVQVNNIKNDRFYARLGVDGTSIQQGDDYRARADFFADDLIGINDQLIVNYNQSLAETTRSLSKGLGFDYSFPWHYSLFSISGNRFEYENIVNGSNQNFEVSGDNTVFSLAANHTLYRNRSIKLDVASSLTAKDINNFIEDTRIDVSSRRLSVFRVETKHKQYLWKDMTVFLNLSIDAGLDILGADDDGQSIYPDKAQFVKYGFLTSAYKPLYSDLLGVWGLGASAQYQHTGDILPSSEKLLVASSSQLTGYGPLNLTGNTGGWLRFDANSPYFYRSDTTGAVLSSRISLMKGWVPHNSLQPFNYGNATATELAFIAQGYGFSLELMIGKTIASSSSLIAEPDNPEFGLKLAYNTL